VLSSGENVEPAPIEDACTVSPFIQHMVLLGQDHRMLGALVVPSAEAFAELEQIKGGCGRSATASSMPHSLC
jgi:long-chain acyl-CoA synthetase